jgi:hypothetical protein
MTKVNTGYYIEKESKAWLAEEAQKKKRSASYFLDQIIRYAQDVGLECK